jgi:SpoVK/Ycf46/Vps4 family AAA+-type ATPase
VLVGSAIEQGLIERDQSKVSPRSQKVSPRLPCQGPFRPAPSDTRTAWLDPYCPGPRCDVSLCGHPRKRTGGTNASAGDGTRESESALNQLLVEMDGFDPTSRVIVLACTNRLEVRPSLLLSGAWSRPAWRYAHA